MTELLVLGISKAVFLEPDLYERLLAIEHLKANMGDERQCGPAQSVSPLSSPLVSQSLIFHIDNFTIHYEGKSISN